MTRECASCFGNRGDGRRVAIKESLKWGEPAYVPRNKSGSSIRMDWKTKHPERYAMYFNCQTTLVDRFRSFFPTTFAFEGNRAFVFALTDKLPRQALAICIAEALTYHRLPKART